MKKKIFHAKDGAQFNDSKAQLYGEQLEVIKKEKDKKLLTPEDVLDDASDQNSPLHEYFDWSDTIAARHWRKHQARNLVNAIEIEVVEQSTIKKVKAHYNVVKQEPEAEQGERGYVSREDAKKDPDLRVQLLQKAVMEIKAWAARWDGDFNFTELKGIMKEIKKL